MRIKNLPSIESMDGSQDALVIEQTDGSEDKSRKVSPAQIKQYVLNDMDDVPTQNSNNPVKSGGIFSTMAVPKYDATNRREYYEGGAAFDGNIDSSPTAGSNNAVASGGTKTYVDNAVSQLNDEIGDLSQTGLTGDSVAAQLTTAKNQIANKIKIASVTVTTSADGIAAVFYNSDIKLGKVIGVYLDNPASTYRFCTMMVNPVSDRFYIFVYNYNLTVIANTAVTIRVVCYD